MKSSTTFILSVLLSLFIANMLAVSAYAENNAVSDAHELEISVTCPDGKASALIDGKEKSYTSASSVTITSNSGEPFGSLYVIFDRIYGPWTLTYTDSDGATHTANCGKDEFLHEYIDVESELDSGITELTLIFDSEPASLSELHAFSSGKVPEWVQIWQPPCSRADLLLASTHVDDEQLFFAGILPYFAGELGYAVQVVYFTDPFSYHDRPHEQLNGLWTVGVKNYPVWADFVDKLSETSEEAYRHQEKYGYTKDDMIRFQVETIRRFKPHVVVGHDINGEYGHGQHMINCETLMEALPLATDANYDAESAAKYGVWDVPKTYIHLWNENKIVMDWDVPLESFGGKTAFQVSQDGFMCHESQHWTWFYEWIYGKNGKSITKATEIRSSSPCKYGLYRSNVGLDSGIGDMFENIPQSYAEIEQEEKEHEERERLEKEREERERAESESLAAESRLAAEEASRLESELEESRRIEAEMTRTAPTEPTGVPETDLSDVSSRRTQGNLKATAGILLFGVLAAVLLAAVAIHMKKRKR